MITIIHGDDTNYSRNYYFNIKSKTKNPLILEEEKLNLEFLVQSVEGKSLFESINEIFIENLLSKKKTVDNQKEIIEYLKNADKDINIFLWENTELSPSNLSIFKNAKIETFKFPQALFAFLDSMRPKNLNNIALFHEVLKNSEPEIVFFMMIRQFRFLIALSDESSAEQIDEIKRLAPWQKAKFIKQAGVFELEELKEIYKKIFEIDYFYKSGRLSTSLTQAIDIFLSDL